MAQYTQNWNSEFVKNTAFLDRHSISSALEIGSFEGLTSNFICDELLAHNGTLICVDPLEESYTLDASANDNEIFHGQYERFIENTEHNKEKIWLIRKRSEQVLHSLRENSVDLIYVDGHHRYNAVYYDGTESFKLLKPFGFLLFDDYLYNHATFEVKKAIDRVLEENPNHRLLLRLNQVLIQKLPEGSSTEDGRDDYQNKSIEKLFSWDNIHGAYCNLDSQPTHNEKMIAELNRVGLPFVRQRSFPWKELYDNYTDEQKEEVSIMFKRTPGAIGCYRSQMAVMEEALRQNKHAVVLEDDVLWCNDIHARLKIIFKFLNQHDWSVFWFGGTWHTEPTWHKSVEGTHTHPEIKHLCGCNLNRDWEETNDPRIVKTFGAFSTFAYMVNKDRLRHVLDILERDIHKSIGIDFTFILEQPNLDCYAFRPGCAYQFDHESTIGNGVSRFSGFSKLGDHWFAGSMDDYKY